MSSSDKLYALALMLGGLGALVALARWDEVADHLVSALKVPALKRPRSAKFRQLPVQRAEPIGNKTRAEANNFSDGS